MSVIVAKSAICCTGVAPPVTYSCYPAVTTQVVVPVGLTLTIDGASTAAFRTLKWFVVVVTASGTRLRTYELHATHRLGTNPAFVYYSILGDQIVHQPSIMTTGGVMNLQIENDDTEDLIVYVTRLSTPITGELINNLDLVEVGNTDSFVRAGASGTIDFVSIENTIAAKWSVTVTSPDGSKTGVQIYSLTVDPADCTVYGLVGDSNPLIEFDVASVAGLGVELILTNNSTDDYKVDVTRIPVQLHNGVPYCGPSSRGLSLWIPGQTTLPAGALTVIDSQIDVPQHSGVKWLAGITDPISGNTMAFEIFLTHMNSDSSAEVTYAFIGDAFNVDVSSAIVNDQIVLSVQNNEPTNLIVNLLRIPVAL